MSLSVELFKKVSAQQTIMSNSAPASRPAGAGGGRLAQFKVNSSSKYTYYWQSENCPQNYLCDIVNHDHLSYLAGFTGRVCCRKVFSGSSLCEGTISRVSRVNHWRCISHTNCLPRRHNCQVWDMGYSGARAISFIGSYVL